MILLFPNFDTLRLALTSQIVSTDVTLAPAVVSFDGKGQIYLESSVSLSKAAIKNLDRIGVKGSKRHATETPEEVSCWPQVLPLTREPGTPNVSSQAAVLFELSDADDMPTLVTEMLRLGNDRQAFRWFATPGDSDARRMLLRVIGPPYYTLLRALDPSAAGAKGNVRAYLERAPRVWVEIGYRHPVAEQIRVADHQLLLIRSPREWVYLDEAPFQDVYESLQFKLPASPVAWTEAKAPKKLAVPLRLTAGNSADVPELWVLRDNAVEQLDVLVRDSDEKLIQRLMFAVATDPDGTRTVILRTRPSKLPPPHLALEHAVRFKPFWKLPNLFIPIGRRLHPTLRRDAVRKLLADDADQVVWLYPGEGGSFTPESVADGAFRELGDWVDYVIEAEQKPLAAWIESTRFDFDTFICKDVTGPKNKPDKGDKEPKLFDDGDEAKGGRGSGTPAKTTGKGKPTAKPSGTAELVSVPEVVQPPSEWRIRREELEKQFLAVEGALDSPERVALWPELAVANTGEGQKEDAAVCWLNAMWNADPIPAEWLAGWLRSEWPHDRGTIRAEEFDKLLARIGGKVEAREAIAGFLYLASQNPVPAWLTARLPAVQTYLEKNEAALPIRAVWLAGYRLSQLAGADVLGLARVRDRLLQRLLNQGLQAEIDLPGFLRFHGHKDSERLRVVRDNALELHAAVRNWSKQHPQNLPYIDLYFAFALAKLNETTSSKKLVEDARKVMDVPIPTQRSTNDDTKATSAIVSNYLFKAFKFRVDQVLHNKNHAEPFSKDVLQELDAIQEQSAVGPVNNPYKLAHYAIARLREQSQILEPHEKLDPYSEWTKNTDALKKELSDLHGIKEPGKLADRIRKLYRDGVQGKVTKIVQFHLLHEALPLAPRVGESFTVDLLLLVKDALAGLSPTGANEPPETPKKQGELLERALQLAGHYGRTDLVKMLVDAFSDLVHGKPEEARFRLINIVAGQCLRSLKKLDMRDDIDRFLNRLHQEILRGSSIDELRKKYAARPEMWNVILQTLLSLAGGWLSYGLKDRAEPILKEARNELLTNTAAKLQPKDYPPLAQAYITALGHGPSESGMARIAELFRTMDEKRTPNTWTTGPYYSRFHLNIVEDTILAIVSDDFALGPAGRKWLDDDEYLVRRRIHADMRRHLDKSGL